MRAAIVFCISFIIAPANAQQVYKCVKGKDVSYQSAPCDGTQTLLKRWEAAPEPEPPAIESGHRQPQRRRSEGNSRPSRSSGSRTRTTSSIDAGNRCRAAKARREAKLASVGLKRTFDLLRKLDDAVHEACK
ncbi:MAG TPA: hypothetical protein VFH12_10965 [Pseudoxanthomonas sp.]|nr:hypothetical protein [Pseudoxanthomonas sp.]